MYLSRLEINPMRREARRLLGNPQVMHACVMKSCARGGTPERQGRILWRIDEEGDRVNLYTVSPDAPDWTDVHGQVGWPETPPRTADYGPFLERLATGQCYAFRLTANPTHVATEAGVKKRFGHVTVAQQEQWLLERCTSIGFEIRTVQSQESLDLVVRNRAMRTFRRQSRPVTLSQVTFDGTLRVTEPNSLRTALISGIGRAKAYGCGLLTLAPVT